MKRTKANRKTMQAYISTFGFREPFQVLVDAEFALKAATQKLELVDRLSAVLGGKVKPMISQCSMEQLYSLGNEGQAAVDLARSEVFSRKKCNHWTKTTSEKCTKGLLGEDNKLRYCVATQSVSLREHLRSIPGTPLLYINSSSVLILEPLSEASSSSKTKIDDAKTHVSAEEAADLALDPSTAPSASTSTAAAASSRRPNETLTAEALLNKNKRRKGQKTKGPNPLSMKKPKSTAHKKKTRAGGAAAGQGPSGVSGGQRKERKLRKKVKDRQAAGAGGEGSAAAS